MVLTAAIAMAGAAQAQFQAPSGSAGSAGGGGSPAFGQTDSFSNVTTSFDGIDVNVMRLIADPAGGGALRLILRLTSTADDDRRLLFVGPPTSLIDELGNVYMGIDSVGVEICRYNNAWYTGTDWCLRNQGGIATRLAPGVPVTVAFRFQPTEDFSAELAELSQTVSLRSRIAHFANDLSSASEADIVVNGIPVPR